MKYKTKGIIAKLRGRWRYLSVMLFLFAGILNGLAQNTVSGIVTDAATGESLIGVVVVNKANNLQNTITDKDGKFAISIPADAVLEFKLLGYANKEVNVGSQTSLNIMLNLDEQLMEEVVVIGYGTVKRKDVLGAITMVKGDDLADRTSGNMIGSLRGLTSGVKITSSGQPGSNASVQIRGLGSLTSNTPLYIIDGVYTDPGVILNVEDVESVQVLKDASSAAIYGSRAANGVIIITTKQGQEGPLKVKFESQLKLNWLPRYDLMNAETYKIYNDMAYDEAIRVGVSGVTKRQSHYDADTDWQDEMLGTGLFQNYNVSMSGGAKTMKYYVSLNRTVDDGALYDTSWDRYAFRVNTSGQKGIFSYGQNLSIYRGYQNGINTLLNPWSSIIGIPPTIPVYDDSHVGGYGFGNVDRANSYGNNPIAAEDLYTNENLALNMRGNIYGQISLFNNMLDAKLNVAYISSNTKTDLFRKLGAWVMGQSTTDSQISLAYNQSDDITIEQTYNFKHEFGKHDVNALAGMTYNHYFQTSSSTIRLDPLRNGDVYIKYISAATGNATATGTYAKSVLISYLGRINYSYDGKYLMQLTARRDGTSRLPKNSRWDNFISGSLGWRISGEDFFNVSWIDDLKLRANYGTLGNSSIGYWDYQAVILTSPRAIFGDPERREVGMTQARLSNNDLRWERKTTTNVGVDAVTLNNRLRFTAEYFYSKSTDLLYNLPILLCSGNQGGNPAVNAGSLENKGFEVEAGWNDRVGNVRYFASINASYVKNKVLYLGYGQDSYTSSLARSSLGEPLGMWYLYRMLGIFQSEAEVLNHVNSEGKVIQPNARPGDIIYEDYNDDGIISSDDRQILENRSPWPKLEMGVNLGVEYKGFDLRLIGYGRFGQTIYNAATYVAGDMAENRNLFNGHNPWTSEHPNNNTPRLIYGDSRNTRSDQDRWLEDGSFFRLSDITLGYTIPVSASKKIGLDNIRLSLTMQNLVTFTKYTGLDPEFADSDIFTIGYNNCSFPNPRAVQFALSFTF